MKKKEQMIFSWEKWVSLNSNPTSTSDNTATLNALLAEGWRVSGAVTPVQNLTADKLMYRGALMILERDLA